MSVRLLFVYGRHKALLFWLLLCTPGKAVRYACVTRAWVRDGNFLAVTILINSFIFRTWVGRASRHVEALTPGTKRENRLRLHYDYYMITITINIWLCVRLTTSTTYQMRCQSLEVQCE